MMVRIKSEQLRVALVHDWLTGMRGGEKVLEVFCELFPRAPVFTLLHDPGSVSPLIESHQIHTSFINRLPGKKSHYRNYLPFFPTAVELFDLKSYHLILSSSHCVAKGILTPPDALHISYLHTPMRYVWDMYHEYFGKGRSGGGSRKVIPFFANYLRMWDVSSSHRVDEFLANSFHVARRISKYYGRTATVIHPPVETSLFRIDPGNDGYDLVVSALVPYKKVDLALAAYNQMNKKLLVIGNGPEEKRLRKIAGPSIEFLDWQPHHRLVNYYSRCRALIFPGEEDFGIVPIEAMSCGKPVIAFGRGGACETVRGDDKLADDERTGVFFEQATIEDMISAVGRSEKIEWHPENIAQHAAQFDRALFIRKIREFIENKSNIFWGK